MIWLKFWLKQRFYIANKKGIESFKRTQSLIIYVALPIPNHKPSVLSIMAATAV